MRRGRLLATSTAILLPITGAFAQGVDADAGVNAGVSGGGATASAEVEGNASVGAGNAGQVTDTAKTAAEKAAGQAEETIKNVGQAATTTAEKAAGAVDEAVDHVADSMTPSTSADAGVAMEADARTVGDITGRDVVDATGEVIGNVEMVVEQSDGKAAVIGIGGFLGIGEHDVAIPVADLTIDAEGRLALSGYTEEDLRQRQAFNASDAVTLSADVELPEMG